MNVCVVNGVTGEHLATLAVEHTAAARQVQQLLKSLLGIPKKEQCIVCDGRRLSPLDGIPRDKDLTLVRVLPTCANCGARPAALRSCAGCLDAHYCDGVCQGAHWRRHRGVCIPSRPKYKAAATHAHNLSQPQPTDGHATSP